jgi:hypothetical protein
MHRWNVGTFDSSINIECEKEISGQNARRIIT